MLLYLFEMLSMRSSGSTPPTRQEEQPEGGDAAGGSPGHVERWLGRYWLGPRIGSGGMGSVNLAMMTGAAGFARLVAVKRLHAQHLESAGLRARFRDEIRLSAKVVHPNVVQVLDVIQSGPELLFAMEYVHGDTLRALLMDAKEPLAIDVALGIAVPLLLGLEAAHTARDEQGAPLGIVHRDVSPHNVLLSADGDVKVLDFGVAKAAIRSQLTQPGSLAGKVGYASPEQARGAALDARSDIFSAGIVIWETLTGRRLFRAENASDVATLANVLEMEIEPPSRFRAGVPAGLDDVILRALQRDRERRYATAGELAAALCGVCPPAPAHVVGAAFGAVCATRMARRTQQLARFRERYRGVKQPPSPERISLGDLTDTAALNLESQSRPSDFLVADSNVSAPPPRTRREPEVRGRVRGWLLSSALLGVLALATAGWTLRHRATEETRAPTAEPLGEASAALPVVEAPGPAVQELAPPPSAEPSATSTAAAPAAATSSSARAADASPRRPAGRAKKAASPTRSAPETRQRNCSPPTYVDASGIRHFKPECL